MSIETTLHRDGTVSYWSVHRQQWIRTAFLPPDHDSAALGERDRMRVARHIAAYGEGAEEAQAWLDEWRAES